MDSVEPDHFDIESYTNGNMQDLIREEKKAEHHRMRMEFLNEFGGISVIQETEEPEDEMTLKHSCQSSSLLVMRLDSINTPQPERMSREPVPNGVENYSFITSPRLALMR